MNASANPLPGLTGSTPGLALSTLRRAPGALASFARQLPERLGEGLRTFADGNSVVAAQELANKVRVFFLVLGVGELLGLPAGRFELPRYVARAYRLGDYPALWAVEGLGHDYAERRWPVGGEAPRGLLRRPLGVPAKSLLMLHAGMGLAFAQRLLRDLTPASSPRRVAAAAERFVGLCWDNSRRGYAGAALESLGLQTYAFHPAPLTPAVHRALAAASPDVVPYFWHGVGRAIYFDFPANFLPCSDWVTFDTARRLAPDEQALLNAWAGLAWAYTLVNQRQPRIVASLLVGPHGGRLAANGAFSNGVSSSAMMRAETTPGAPFIGTFCAYEPPPASTAAAWRRLVRDPCETALEVCLPRLRKERRLDEIFRYRQALC